MERKGERKEIRRWKKTSTGNYYETWYPPSVSESYATPPRCNMNFSWAELYAVKYDIRKAKTFTRTKRFLDSTILHENFRLQLTISKRTQQISRFQ